MTVFSYIRRILRLVMCDSLSDGLVHHAKPGDNVTLQCFHDRSTRHVCWYRQDVGEQPKVLFYYYIDSPPPRRYDHFEGVERYSVDAHNGLFHLNISNVRHSDSAVYYCGQIDTLVTSFKEEIYLVLKGKSFEHNTMKIMLLNPLSKCSWSVCCSESGPRSSLQQPEIQSVQLGGSIALNCTVHTGACDDEHSVYWFKEDSRDFRLGFMYVHDSSSQCLKDPEVPAESCTFILPQRNMNRADAGTYYCAVASCGQILLSKGARVGVGGENLYFRNSK